MDLKTAKNFSGIRIERMGLSSENDLYMGVEQGRQAHEAIAGSKLVVLPSGHAAAVELPEKFNSAVLEFLSEVK